jgi:hypothetical protein
MENLNELWEEENGAKDKKIVLQALIKQTQRTLK